MVDYTVISSREQALKAWDKKRVIIREDDGYYFVYPLIGKGFKYPGFKLRRECYLNTFLSFEKAVDWALDKGYTYTSLN